MEMTAQRLAMAQFIPASTVAVEPEPVLVSTLPAKICERQAMP